MYDTCIYIDIYTYLYLHKDVRISSHFGLLKLADSYQGRTNPAPPGTNRGFIGAGNEL